MENLLFRTIRKPISGSLLLCRNQFSTAPPTNLSDRRLSELRHLEIKADASPKSEIQQHELFKALIDSGLYQLVVDRFEKNHKAYVTHPGMDTVVGDYFKALMIRYRPDEFKFADTSRFSGWKWTGAGIGIQVLGYFAALLVIFTTLAGFSVDMSNVFSPLQKGTKRDYESFI